MYTSVSIFRSERTERQTAGWLLVLFLTLVFSGCADEGSYRLRLVFPGKEVMSSVD